MAKHLNPLEKEFLIRQFKSNRRIRLSDFCTANHVSDAAFRKWLRQYNEGGIEGMARADMEIREVLPEGIDRTEEAYKREILKLRIENERLKKKLCRSDQRSWGTGVCSFKGEEFEIVDLLSRDYSIKNICEMMGVSRSGFYKWKHHKPSSRDVNREEMIEHVRLMSRAGKPTDNPVNEALNGWIKEELNIEYHIDRMKSKSEFEEALRQYVMYYNEKRPCYAIGYDTPGNYRKRFYKGELEQRKTFEDRILSTEPKFVQKKRNTLTSEALSENVSTFVNENDEKLT